MSRRCQRRGSLQRRLFLWFGLTIVLTGASVGAVSHLAAGSGSGSFAREIARVHRWLGGQLAGVWDQPAALDALAAGLARDMELQVTLRAADGRELGRFGPGCRRPRGLPVLGRIPVVRRGVLLGTVELCADRYATGPINLAVTLALACAGLWLASGLIARRLARPHAKLAQLAQDIGAGRLSSRARLDRKERGEVGLLADAIDEMAARIERQISDQRQLLAMVSHELRGPLQRMRLLIELARDGAGAEQLSRLEREVLEIDALVGELLATARLDFAALSPRPLDAAALAREALERAGHPADKLAVEAASTALVGDPTLLARALFNLIDNADRHGGGLLRLRVRSEAERLVFEAEDGGAGLPPGGEAQVFLPFRRLTPDGEEPSPRPQGIGLGLALVRRIAEAHGGEAHARNQPEGGALIGFSVRAG